MRENENVICSMNKNLFNKQNVLFEGMPHTVCDIPYAAYRMRHTVCGIPYAANRMRHTVYGIPYAAYTMPLIDDESVSN